MFRTEIELDEEQMLKLFRIHAFKGGSDITLPEVIDEVMMAGLDIILKEYINERSKDNKKV